MKKILVTLLLGITTVSFAQEKVLLRLNYKKGDRYETEMKMNQDMGVGKMEMVVKMQTTVEGKNKDGFDTKMNFTYLSSYAMQGGQEKVNFNTDMKESEMTAEQKQFKASIAPILGTTMFMNVSKLGKNKLVKVEPSVPGVDKLTNQVNTILYPEEPVSVGSTWNKVNSTQGIQVDLTYTVKEITKDKVTAVLKGKSDKLPGSIIEGTVEIDRKSGVPLKSVLNMSISAGGMSMKNTTIATVRKL